MDQTRTHKFLLLEDDESDVFLMRRQLSRKLEHVELLVASTQEDYEELIRTAAPDVILSDYRLPRYSGIEALLYAREHSPLVPFIFVTGALHNEELAADTILQGASGFVLKNNLDKLWKLLPDLLERGGSANGQAGGDAPGTASAKTAPAKTAPAKIAPAKTASAKTASAAPSTAKPDVEPDAIAAQVANADPETLAKIRELLGQRS